MAKDKKYWKKSVNKYHRSFGSRGLPKQRFLIICEGGKTEPYYFRSFKVLSARVEIIGLGTNTTDLVKQTRKIVLDYKKDSLEFDQIWCVFDKDSFTNNNFNTAIQMAIQSGYKVAYSNEAFELWYLLHYNYYDSALSRTDYITKLTQLIGKKYEKNSIEMYQLLLPLQEQAILNSEKLYEIQKNESPCNANPSTRVHELVKQLNIYK